MRNVHTFVAAISGPLCVSFVIAALCEFAFLVVRPVYECDAQL